MTTVERSKIIRDELLSMGVTARYKGYDRTIYALCLIGENTDMLQEAKKNVYEPTASHFDCSVDAVLRSVHTVIIRAWDVNAEELRRLAGHPMRHEPSVTDFLSIVATYINISEQE